MAAQSPLGIGETLSLGSLATSSLALEEIETSLGGEAIATLEELEVEEGQLRQVQAGLEESARLVDAIISEDPAQTDAMKDAEAAKSVSADSKI